MYPRSCGDMMPGLARIRDGRDRWCHPEGFISRFPCNSWSCLILSCPMLPCLALPYISVQPNFDAADLMHTRAVVATQHPAAARCICSPIHAVCSCCSSCSCLARVGSARPGQARTMWVGVSWVDGYGCGWVGVWVYNAPFRRPPTV